MAFTYILRCSDGSLYTGWTNDIEKRVKTHNGGRGAKYTRPRLPVTLVYFENFDNKINAQKREAEIKKLTRSAKLKLINGFNMEEKMMELNLSRNINSEEPLEDIVAKLLLNRNLTIVTAESCTGGMIASMLINYPGISSVFIEGIVCYSNESKIKRLGVSPGTIEKYGAVSQETAEEMALGAAQTSGADVAVSVTGIAGPGGGSDEKPVGLVYVGLYINGKTATKKLNLKGSRYDIRHSTAMTALEWLREELSSL